MNQVNLLSSREDFIADILTNASLFLRLVFVTVSNFSSEVVKLLISKLDFSSPYKMRKSKSI